MLLTDSVDALIKESNVLYRKYHEDMTKKLENYLKDNLDAIPDLETVHILGYFDASLWRYTSDSFFFEFKNPLPENAALIEENKDNFNYHSYFERKSTKPLYEVYDLYSGIDESVPGVKDLQANVQAIQSLLQDFESSYLFVYLNSNRMYTDSQENYLLSFDRTAAKFKIDYLYNYFI